MPEASPRQPACGRNLAAVWGIKQYGQAVCGHDRTGHAPLGAVAGIGFGSRIGATGRHYFIAVYLLQPLNVPRALQTLQQSRTVGLHMAGVVAHM